MYKFILKTGDTGYRSDVLMGFRLQVHLLFLH